MSAASMGPRSWDRGEANSPGAGKTLAALQWGRGLGTAESELPFYGYDLNDTLASMGPRSWDRGERSPCGVSAGCGRSFNGAAVLGPRRGQPRQLHLPDAQPLQWGRGLGT